MLKTILEYQMIQEVILWDCWFTRIKISNWSL